MADNWAIVIGIDRYDAPEARLNGAVNDALRMREWLLRPDGGGVPARNLACLLSAHPGRDVASTGALPATTANVITTIERVLERSGAEGDRFYFYFAGHGLSARLPGNTQSGMAFADFTNVLRNNSLTAFSLFDLFQSTQFKEQFFFIDGCRDAPFDTESVLGAYPKPRLPKPPVRPQFVMFAAALLQQAIQVNEHGAFTDALLDGLAGNGRAKIWDANEGLEGAYIVRWSTLFKYVKTTVEARRLSATHKDAIQVPRRYGEDSGEDPVLGRAIAPADAARERLTVHLAPDRALPESSIFVRDLSGVVKTEPKPITSVPVAFELPPRSYGVAVEAAGWKQVGSFKTVDLYEPADIAIELELDPDAAGAVRSVPKTRRYNDFAVKGFSFDPLAGVVGAPRTTTLTVRSNDTLASLEIADESGKIIAGGRGTADARRLSEGFYRARLISPEGDVAEELVHLEAGDQRTVTVVAPVPDGPVLDRLIDRADFRRDADGTVWPSEAVGPSAWLRLSTVLALGASASVERERGYGFRLRSIGFPDLAGMPPATSGIEVVVGSDDETWAARQTIAFDAEAPAHAQPVGAEPAIGALVHLCAPGSHIVTLRDRDAAGAMQLALDVLPGRLTLVVVTREGARVTTNIYMPPFGGDPGTHPSPVDLLLRDPDHELSAFAAVRRIELMQRAAANGRVTPTRIEIDLLLHDKWRDPVAGCLGAYLGLRLGTELASLDEASTNLGRYFGSMPDAHVVRGAVLDALERGAEAAAAYRAALERGIPMFRDGIALLTAAASRLRLAHPNLAALRDYAARPAADPLWSSVLA
jgi:Caspase domain